MSMNKVPLKELDQNLGDKRYALILGLGFDPRCLKTIKAIHEDKLVHIIGISNASWVSLSGQNMADFKRISGGKDEIVGDKTENIIEITDKIAKYLDTLTKDKNLHFIVDVTSFSHELLSILLGLMNSYNILDTATFLYVGASEYSFNNTQGIEGIWLSRGVGKIRSVLGFPGMMLPSKKLHLILFAGFETERATHVINAYEPTYLSIGTGRKSQSVNHGHYDTNKFFVERLNKFIKEQDLYNDKINHFEFSCVDPCQTKKDLLDHIDSFSDKEDRNFVVCPLNTKLSTVGITLASLERPNIQICYAEPLEYNTEGYAKPGEDVTIVSLNTCSPSK